MSTPTIVTQPQSQAVYSGQDATFTVVASGTEPLSYQWYLSYDGETWSSIFGATSASYTVSASASSYLDGNQYRCVVSNNDGSVTSETATLTVKLTSSDPGTGDDPSVVLVITRQPASQTTAAGSSVTFSVEAQGNDLTYRWEYRLPNTQNWIYANGDSSSITIPNVDSDHNGVQYRCIVADGFGNSLTSNSATLAVTSSEPGTNPNPGEDDVTFKIVRQPKNATAISGAETTFSVVAQGTDLSYQWQFSSDSGSSWLDVQSDGESNAYTFTVGDAQNGYLFRCVIAQGTEILITDSVRLTVRNLPSSPERRTYLPSEMADAIRRLGLAGIDLDDIPFGNMPDGLAITTLGSKGATSPEWYEEIAEAINILKDGIDIEDYQIFKVKNITENGEYAAVEDDCYGYSLVDIDVFGGDSIVDRTVSEPYINDKITMVGAYAFCSCSSLPSVDIPNCTIIDVGAFSNCSTLSFVNAPNCSVVRSSAFQRCNGLPTISLPSCVSVGDYAFDNCYVLSSIDLPVCKKIGSRAFGNCPQLVSVDFPLCETIGDGAFQSCMSLASVSLPVCYTMGNEAFIGCSGLLSIELPLCKNIGSSAFRQCYNLAEVSFPECTSIGSFAFYGCQSLSYASFSLCTKIGQSAFCRCYSLSHVSIPSCSEVGGCAFSSCSALSAISLPNCSVIRNAAFISCQNLSSLYLYGSSVCRLEASNALYGTALASGTGRIYVLPSLYSEYISASNWSYYSSRFYYEINVSASMNGMVLELSGAGATLSSNNLSLRDTAVSMSSNQLVFH